MRKILKKYSGLKLWSKAIKIIPGGNGLLSKRPERYLPDLWPTYFSKSKGCFVWDLDGNKYIDMAQNGIGSAILGYADPDVDKAVIDCLKKGVNTTLNSPDEFELAKLLLKLNPTMDMVKFARGGGEALSIAVRLARAKTGLDKILFSGYHGWCDWYIAANVSSNSNLDDHLIPGLNPAGVPRKLKNTAIPFIYDDIEDFKKQLKLNPDVAAIIIEGARYNAPSLEFLNFISKEAKKRKIILIVDEVTSGFRICNSGTYRKYKYDPDIAVYGKALGNGYAISAVVGKKNVMEMASKSFISSTMWTENVGFAAAKACLKKINKIKLHVHLNKVGRDIAIIWRRTSKASNLKISVSNFYPLITFKFNYGDLDNKLLTLFIQEMLERGFLASSSVYVTAAHNQAVLKKYAIACKEVFEIIKIAIDSNSIDSCLKTKPRYDSFARLNKQKD